MPTYRELMDAAEKADKAGDSVDAKRLLELASIEQGKSTAPVDTQLPAGERIGGFLPSFVGPRPVENRPETFTGRIGSFLERDKENPSFDEGQLMSAAAPTGREMLAATVRNAPPIIASIISRGRVAAPSSIAVPSELLARKIEGLSTTDKEAAGEAAFAGVSNLLPQLGLGKQTSMLGRAFMGGLKTGAATATIFGGAEQARSLINTGELMGPKEMFDRVKLATLFGTGLGGLAGSTGSIADTLQTVRASRDVLESIGVKNPTLGALVPAKFGDLEAAIATTSPSVAAQREGMIFDTSEFVKRRLATNPELATNEALAKQFQDVVPKYDEAYKRFTSAQTALDDANAKLAQAQETLSPEFLEKAKDELLVSQFNAVSAKALSAKANALSDLMDLDPTIGASSTQYAKEVSQQLKETIALRKQTASQMIGEINKQGSFINGESIRTSVQTSLGKKDLDTDAGKSIMATLDRYLKKRKPEQPESLIAIDRFGNVPKAPEVPTMLSMDEFRELRNDISNDLLRLGDAVSYSTSEAMAAKVYGAASDSVSKQIEKLPDGKNLVKQYDAFKTYYRETSEILNSKLGNSLLNGTITDDAISSLATNLIGGKADDIAQYVSFVNAVSKLDPNVRAAALTPVVSAIKTQLLTKNTSAGRVNWNGVAEDALEMSKYTDMKQYFDVASLGFGDEKAIRAWSKATKSFKPGELRPDDIALALDDPRFQEVLVGSKEVLGVNSEGSQLRRLLSEAAFANKVKEAAINRESGRLGAANVALAEARAFAKKAGMDNDAQKAVFQSVSDNPEYSIFSGKGNFSLTRDPSKTTQTITNFILGSDTPNATAWMAHLRKNNPDAALIVSENMIANQLRDFLVPSKYAGSSTQVDVKAVRQYLESADYVKVKKIMGEEYSKRFDVMLKGISSLDDALMMKPGTNYSKTLGNFYGMVAGLQNSPKGVFPRQQIGQTRFLTTLGSYVGNGAYRSLAMVVTRPNFADPILGLTRAFSDSVAMLPSQQAIILMNDSRLIEEQAKVKQAQEKANQQAPSR